MSKRKACPSCGHIPEEDGSEVEEASSKENAAPPKKRGKKTITTYFDRDFDAAATKSVAHADTSIYAHAGKRVTEQMQF